MIEFAAPISFSIKYKHCLPQYGYIIHAYRDDVIVRTGLYQKYEMFFYPSS